MIAQGIEYFSKFVNVDIGSGVITWVNPPSNHSELAGKEAGGPRVSHSGKSYWVVKVNGAAYKRAHIVYLFANGEACTEQVDHINGNSLDDRATNLRSATPTQNAWNHKKRARKIDLSMGVRNMASGKYQARIACNKTMVHLGTFDTPEQAASVYQQKRKEYFGEYA